MKIQDLPEPYKSLALLRQKQNINGGGDDIVAGAFTWAETPEGHSWWAGVSKGELPEVPKASLKELKYYSGFAWKDVIREAVKDVKSRRKSIYIAGPMRGIPFFNFPSFDAAHDKLEDEGWNVISPADLDREHGFDALDLEPDSDWNDLSKVPFSIEECFDRDMEAIKKADAIYMLKGWQNSTGAQAEYWCAKWLHKEILFEEESICEEAFRIQGGDRQQDYGDPTKNFDDIANLWNAYFQVSDDKEAFYFIEARDVAHMMILMKIARNCHKPKRDSIVDMAGYAQCLGKIDKV